MDDQQPGLINDTGPKRPVLLTVLCILTFAGSGMNMLSNLLVFVFYSTFQTVGENILKTIDLPGVEDILNAQPIFFVSSVAAYAVSIFGAFQMWQLRKRGFHIYLISQILLVIIPMYFFKLASPLLADIILSGIFIILYGSNLKHMS